MAKTFLATLQNELQKYANAYNSKENIGNFEQT